MKNLLIWLLLVVPFSFGEITEPLVANSKTISDKLSIPKTFEVPKNFNWSGNLSSLANTECIISNAHIYSDGINLPAGIKLNFKPGGKLTSKSKKKVESSDLTSWATKGDATINSANKFSTKKNGRISLKNVLIGGKVYTVHLKGKTTSTVEVLSNSSLTTFIPSQTDSFDVTYTVKYAEPSDAINLRSVGEGATTIDIFEILESNPINSPEDYGSTDEKSYPVIINTKGNKAFSGASLSGMYKVEEDIVQMADFFTDNYSSSFFDSFVRTKFLFDKSMVQTGDSEFSVNTNISDSNYKKYKGLSEGCSIEGIRDVVLSNLYTFGTGDFALRNININKGRINICNLNEDSRPLKFRMENVVGTDVRIGNEFPHTAAKSLVTTPELTNVQLNATSGKRNTIYLFATVNAIMTDIKFSFATYKNEGGQPLIILSSINGKYTNISSDKGDSGFMFCMFLPKSLLSAIDWVESHAMDFKGFEGNIIHGGKMANMPEEAFTCDATDSKAPTVTMNRNRFQIVRVTDTEHIVIKARYPDKNYQTWINTMMTSMTKGKAGKYAKIVAIARTKDDNDLTKFTITGPSGFFTGVSTDDKYCVNYAFYNNVIEDMTFTNCNVPILFYLYSYKNTVRRVIVKGSKTSKAGIRQLSYSGRRKRVYLAWSIDNVYEDCDLDGNGFQFEDSKNSKEKINPWLNEDPEPFEADISEDSNTGTIIRNNTISNAPIKLQGLRNVTYQGNKLTNVKEEITDCTFLSNSNTVADGSNNDSRARFSATAKTTRTSSQDVKALPRNSAQIKQTTGSPSLKGSILDLPKNITTLEINDSTSLIDGKVSDLPRSLTYISLKFPLVYIFTPVMKGDLKDLPPNCTYFDDETNGGYYIYTTRTWPKNMRKVLIKISVRNSWTPAMVDLLLNDLAATTWTGEKMVDLSGRLPNRTSASDPAVATLTKMGVTVLTSKVKK